MFNEGLFNLGGVLDNFKTLLNQGTLTVESNGIFGNLSQAEIQNLASMLAKSGSKTTNDGQLTNSGDMTVEAGAEVLGSGAFTQNGNSTTTINGVMDQLQMLFNGGKLKGSGTLRGFPNVNIGTTLAPGNSAGTMTIDGSLFMTDSTLEIELASASLHDLLLVTGDVELDSIIIKYLFDYTPSPGDSFAFLTADGDITGLGSATFQAIGNLSGLTLDTQVIGNSIVMTVVPEPTTGLIAASLLLMARRSRWPRVCGNACCCIALPLTTPCPKW
jgi:hypothetical protein